ncbi:hypothetical protein [Winogradskyella helgolandensis]|uniref:hypothetical protein n=1 Tax=Winogradskyella helgolandensis TaxID=2697010 RepID=UPI0015CED95B|nr:hypothetical protein [Winogradskyella helgolandensis]
MEKFSSLIYGLTTGKGNIKERLIVNSVELHMTFGLEFPEEFKDQKNEIISRLTKFSALMEDSEIIMSSYNRTISKCRYNTIVELTELIANLHLDMQFYLRTLKTSRKE